MREERPRPGFYLALDALGDPAGTHRRVELEAADLAAARAALEEQYGVGSVVSVWNEVAASLPR